MRTLRVSLTQLGKQIGLAMALVACLAAAEPVRAQQPAYEDEGSTATQAGLGAASFLLTIPYGITKVVFAGVGGIVGGLAYVFSGANEETAKNIWTTSIYGTYVITPDHLKGNKAVRFFGVPEDQVDPYGGDARF